jgi:hypothetical protein
MGVYKTLQKKVKDSEKIKSKNIMGRGKWR